MSDVASLGEFEHVVLLAVLRLGDSAYAVSIRDEIERRTDRRVSRGSVYVTLDRLETKGYLKKEKADRAYRYRPSRPERTVISSMVREFVNRVFDGAPRPLLLHLVKDGRLTEKERAQLLKLIDEEG